ncbi:hypothetical protein SEMRO_437_G142860.1 [Seminavis robusta]|uniref:Uncharacterized protein n=1 Tax=Seminavis robusta TaxID=568900 RepID=A0A9N8E0E0_9STRA|nr:hypothetical protein SEMRO_437_G142860.1 [Seminavis robusta]|eukprot:Sro437_g142860.1 n/a (197) ;mRNA; f:45447-46037
MSSSDSDFEPDYPVEFFNKEMLVNCFFDSQPGSNKDMDSLIQDRIKPLTEKAQTFLTREVNRAIMMGKDCTFVCTIGGKYYWKADEFKEWTGRFSLNQGVLRVVTSSNDCLVLLTKLKTVVTVLIYGNNRFDIHKPAPRVKVVPKKKAAPKRATPMPKKRFASKRDQDEEEDGFEEDYELSQQLTPLRAYYTNKGK